MKSKKEERKERFKLQRRKPGGVWIDVKLDHRATLKTRRAAQKVLIIFKRVFSQGEFRIKKITEGKHE